MEFSTLAGHRSEGFHGHLQHVPASQWRFCIIRNTKQVILNGQSVPDNKIRSLRGFQPHNSATCSTTLSELCLNRRVSIVINYHLIILRYAVDWAIGCLQGRLPLTRRDYDVLCLTDRELGVSKKYISAIALCQWEIRDLWRNCLWAEPEFQYAVVSVHSPEEKIESVILQPDPSVKTSLAFGC